MYTINWYKLDTNISKNTPIKRQLISLKYKEKVISYIHGFRKRKDITY